MLLHLGGGFAVDSHRVVMLIDLTKHPSAAQPLLETLTRRSAITRLPGDPATLCLCHEGEEITGIMSPIGLRSLRQRVADHAALSID